MELFASSRNISSMFNVSVSEISESYSRIEKLSELSILSIELEHDEKKNINDRPNPKITFLLIIFNNF